MSNPQTVSQMFPSNINYGDQVFIVMPSLPTPLGPSIVMGVNENGYVFVNTGTIDGGDPYIIDLPTGPPTSGYSSTNPQPVLNNAQIMLRRVNDSSQRVWYTHASDALVGTDYPNSGTGSPLFLITIQNNSTNGIPITYSNTFTLTSMYNNAYVNVKTNTAPDNGNLTVDDTTSNPPYNIFSFLFGSYTIAQLQCCTNNPAYGSTFCGQYYGNSLTGSCDNILTSYCSSVLTNDPNCGCLLPANNYVVNNQSYPPCIDNRCYNTTNAYQTSTSYNAACNVANCNSLANNLSGSNINQSAFTKYCGSVANPPSIPSQPSSQSSSSQPSTSNPPSTPSSQSSSSQPSSQSSSSQPSSQSSTQILQNKYLWIGAGAFTLLIILIILVILLVKNKKS